MSSHRAVKSSRARSLSALSRRPAGGRRRAPSPARRSGAPAAAVVGGVALLVAAAGAATAGQATSSGHGAQPTGRFAHGSYVPSLAEASVNTREATIRVSRSESTPVSRSGVRPTASVDRSLVPAAERQAAARMDKLRAVADDSEVYAEELASDEWVKPTAHYDLSTPFGVAGPYWSTGYHTGADLSAPSGQAVVAPADGVVSQAGWDGAYGNQVRIKLENGDEIWLNHMSALDVSTGDSVTAGQQVGSVGATGNVSSPTAYHIHLEYRLASDLDTGVDPLPYFAKQGVNL